MNDPKLSDVWGGIMRALLAGRWPTAVDVGLEDPQPQPPPVEPRENDLDTVVAALCEGLNSGSFEQQGTALYSNYYRTPLGKLRVSRYGQSPEVQLDDMWLHGKHMRAIDAAEKAHSKRSEEKRVAELARKARDMQGAH